MAVVKYYFFKQDILQQPFAINKDKKMEQKTLNHTDLKISPVALGTAGIGKKYEEEQARLFLNYYCEAGGNLIDTALVYGSKPGQEFMSEKIIGAWMKEKKNRHQLILETKGGHPFGWISPKRRCTGENLLGDIDQSLKNLQTDYVDIYWIHKDDPEVPVAELMDALTTIVKAGKARYVGLSNWTGRRVEQAVQYMKETDGPEIIASQILYSIAHLNLENQVDKEGVVMTETEYEYYKKRPLTVFAYASQAHGFFAKYGNGDLSEGVRLEYLNDYNTRLYQRLAKVAEQYNSTVSEAAIAALIQRKDFDTVPVISFSRTEQLDETLRGVDLKLEKETLDYIFSE